MPRWGDMFNNPSDDWSNDSEIWNDLDNLDFGGQDRSLSGEGLGKWEVGTNVDTLLQDFYPEEWDQGRIDEFNEDYGMYFDEYDPSQEEQRTLQREIEFEQWNHKVNADNRMLEHNQGASGFITSGRQKELDKDFEDLSVLENLEAELDYSADVYTFKKNWEADTYNTIGKLAGMGAFTDSGDGGGDGYDGWFPSFDTMDWWFGDESVWGKATDSDWWFGEESVWGKTVGSISYVCTELTNAGVVSKQEWKDMGRFKLKAALSHPYEFYTYVSKFKKLVDIVNEKNIDWKKPKYKKMFITNVLKLERKGKHDDAAKLYINSLRKLSKEFNVGFEFPKKFFKTSFFDRVQSYFKLILNPKTLHLFLLHLKSKLGGSNV